MNTATFALFCLLAARGFAQQAVPEIPFDSNPDFFKLPDDLHFGETSGVAVNSQGQIYVFNRGNTTGPAYGATASQVLLFDKNGKYLREWKVGAAPVAVVSHRYWTQSLGSAATVADYHLRIEGRAYTVVGVMPTGFQFPAKADLWLPAELNAPRTSRTSHNYAAVGRLDNDIGGVVDIIEIVAAETD